MHEEQIFYLGFGSNMGDSKATIEKAVALLEKTLPACMLKQSSYWYTEPMGDKNQDWFTNCVTIFSAKSLLPHTALDKINEIEYILGRRRIEGNQNAPRTIDIDILDFDGQYIKDERLTLPHPRMFERAFVLVPLLEIAPKYAFNGKRAEDYLKQLTYSIDNKKIYQD